MGTDRRFLLTARPLLEWIYGELHRACERCKKYELEAGMLKGAEDKATREAGEASMRANAIEKRADDAEAALKGAVEENSRLLGKIKGLEAQLKKSRPQSKRTLDC